MKKATLILAVIMLVIQFATAQDFGARIGINASDASINISQAEVETEGASNFVAGIFLDIPTGAVGLSIQPELNYMGRAYEYTFQGGGTEIEYTGSYIDLGALLKFNFNREGPFGAYVGAGPYFNYALKATTTQDGEERDVDFSVDGIRRNELTIGTALGIVAGSDLKVFGEIRYILSLQDQSEQGGQEIKQRSVMLTAGMIF